MREPLLTERLMLRDLTEADAELMFELDSDAEVMRYIGQRLSDEIASYRDRIREVCVPWQAHPWHGLRFVLDRMSGEFLGWVFMRPAPGSKVAAEMGWIRPDEVELGYRYRRSAWGRGVATEAAQPLVQIALADPGTSAVVACAHSKNTGSLRVLEKLGLHRVGEVILPDASEPTVKLARPR